MFEANNTTVARNGRVSSVISGSNAGIRVQCASQEILIKYNELANAARSGNYWAHQIVSGISGLCSGRLHMDNVFVRAGTGPAYGRGDFCVVLPGVTATLEQLDDSNFVLKELNTDNNYQQMQKEGQRPGFWKVAKTRDSWDPTHLPDNKSTNITGRDYVVVSERYDNAVIAADAGSKGLGSINSTIQQHINGASGFKMHYTPGKVGIGGLKNCSQALHPDTDRELNESALLLAQTMYQARDIEGVLWMSDSGGAGVLTQAMRVLVSNNVKLPKHSIFLNRPTTRPSKAVALGLELKLSALGKGQSRGVSLDELVGRLGFIDGPISKLQRVKNDNSYGLTNLAGNAVGGTAAATGLGIGVTGALGAFGVVAIGPVMSTGLGLGGGLLLATGLINKAVKSVAPETHAKIARRLS